MNLVVGKALSLNIVSNDFFVTVLAYGIRVVPAGPELAAPEHFFHLGVKPEDLFCSDTFYCLNDSVRRKQRDTLNEEVNVVLIRTNLYETDLKSFFNTQTHFLKRLFYFLCEYLPSVFGRAYQMVKKQCFIVSPKDVFTHTAILPRSRASRNYLIKPPFSLFREPSCRMASDRLLGSL